MIKFPRTPRANTRLAAEHAALTALQSYLPAGPRRAPRPLACAELAGRQVVVETTLPGRPLLAYLAEHPAPRAAALRRLASLIAWLTALHVGSSRPATPGELQEWVLAPLAAAGEDLAGTARERAALARLHARAVHLTAAAALPTVFNHNDLGPPNILVDQRGGFAGVVDWESGACGLPATDLLYLLARVADTVRDGGYEALFFRAGPEASLARGWLAAYCRRLGLAPAWLPVLFALGWIMHTRNEQRQHDELWAAGGILPALAQEPPPAQMRAVSLLPFRKQLRFYLEHRDACLITAIGESGA